MAGLATGTTVTTEKGLSVKIESMIGEGGQGRVYKVNYNGKPKVLKMYKEESVKNLEWFRQNLKRNISNGAPSEKFIWPEDITRDVNGTFGYIMELRPSDYVTFDDILLAKCEFSSFTAMINCALNIVSAFRVLHRKGYVYQDLNNGNFFVRISDGDVLICDNDNVSDPDHPSGIAGKARYMAPSVVMGGKPSRLTDRFSLGVCLFMLFMRCHPLEGVRTLSAPEMNDYYLQLHYGKQPLFIADPNDKSNGYTQEIHGNFFRRWPLMTKQIKELFTRTFSQEAMLKNEAKYPIETEWCKALLQFRTYFLRCPLCGKETYNDSSSPVCKCCKKPYPMHGIINIGKYNIPIVKDVGIYQEHIDDFSTEEQFYSKRIGTVRTKSSENLVAVSNLSDINWSLDLNGKSGIAEAGGTFRLFDGMSVKIGNSRMDINLE
ncbi:MAG: serine/threonine protein kinase [Ruminococcus sp.]|nr:serine/threonine protein kinase [Ruminococcus sp.]